MEHSLLTWTEYKKFTCFSQLYGHSVMAMVVTGVVMLRQREQVQGRR